MIKNFIVNKTQVADLNQFFGKFSKTNLLSLVPGDFWAKFFKRVCPPFTKERFSPHQGGIPRGIGREGGGGLVTLGLRNQPATHHGT